MTTVDGDMFAIRLTEFGPPGVLHEERVPVPEPGPGQVLIEVAYCGVCRHDLLTRSGAFPRARLPLTLGHQVSGHVAAVGAGVGQHAVGDRVMTMIYTGCGECPQCSAGAEALCSVRTAKFLGEDHDGGYAEYVVVQARTAIGLPSQVGLAEAAIATCTLGTAYHALIGRGELREGQLVAITGASGGVGLHAISIAAAAGATVVGVVSSERGAERAREMGAHEIVVDEQRRFAKELRSRTGRQADLALDIVGAPTLRESMHAVRPGGRVVVLGNVEGKEVSIPPAYLILKEISLVGTKSCSTHEMARLLDDLACGRLTADVTEIVPLAEAASVHRRMESGENVGRVVLEVRPS
ncbi:alcohol dehydrogenase catalytic domain-containing protein [Prauserella flavalba]|nr:alcohol dehydrogenase catalytic domain-containing protein [Prauserella flavalba]